MAEYGFETLSVHAGASPDPSWIARMLTPCALNRSYGYLWWLNTDRRRYPSAPATTVLALGAGGNLIWVEPTLDLVLVARWLEPTQADALMARVLAAISQP